MKGLKVAAHVLYLAKHLGRYCLGDVVRIDPTPLNLSWRNGFKAASLLSDLE